MLYHRRSGAARACPRQYKLRFDTLKPEYLCWGCTFWRRLLSSHIERAPHPSSGEFIVVFRSLFSSNTASTVGGIWWASWTRYVSYPTLSFCVVAPSWFPLLSITSRIRIFLLSLRSLFSRYDYAIVNLLPSLHLWLIHYVASCETVFMLRKSKKALSVWTIRCTATDTNATDINNSSSWGHWCISQLQILKRVKQCQCWIFASFLANHNRWRILRGCVEQSSAVPSNHRVAWSSGRLCACDHQACLNPASNFCSSSHISGDTHLLAFFSIRISHQ